MKKVDKVWVVWVQNHDDADIAGVFTSERRAHTAADKIDASWMVWITPVLLNTFPRRGDAK